MGYAEEQDYVVELKAPSHFYVESEVRHVLPFHGGFEVSKGYWLAHPPNERSTLEGYAELALTILFASKTLKDAEDHALKVGRMFSSLTSAFGGYPLNTPRLHRIAAVDVDERLVSQYCYYYDEQLHESLGVPFDAIVQYRFQRYIEFFSLFDESTRYRLQSAIHWYGVAVGADDPTVSYVAAWTGLECIGLVMNSRFHTQGSRAHCRICGNQTGNNRDRKMAGIEHVFNSGTLEPIEGFSFWKAHGLRNDAVHGLRESESLLQDCSMFRRFLIDLLNVSILTALTPPEYDADKSVRSLGAGDYEFRPCSRASIRFSEGRMSPYVGEWVEGNVDRKPQRRTSGERKLDLVTAAESTWALDVSHRDFVDAVSYEEFRRLGQEEYPLPDREMPPLIPWQDRPTSPAWEATSDWSWESPETHEQV